jgi:nitroreductase
MIKDLILKNRSYRRFYQDKPIEMETLRDLVDLARLSPSGANKQPLKYFLSNTKELNDKIFVNVAWAGYLQDWNGPEEGEKPSAYIVMVKDTTLGMGMVQDEGITGQSILLGAVEKGLGGCFIGNINRKKLTAALNLEAKYEIALVIALGTPKEEVVIEKMDASGDVKYWRDENKVHHVPKRELDDIIL